jgi:tRNA-splicing ligase RtcB
MKKRELHNLGFPAGTATKAAQIAAGAAAAAGWTSAAVRETLRRVLAQPELFLHDERFAKVAQALRPSDGRAAPFVDRRTRAPWRRWGENLDPASIEQLENACRLPVAVAGALMPDAHVGYGLPIGGVLATDNAVIPYAVGVDIACRMKLSVLDLPASAIMGQADRLVNAIEAETRFGMGSKFAAPRAHEVIDADWSVSPVTRRMKDTAWRQLGTSGSGNHFVEFGILTLATADLGLEPGAHLALMTHSGSRGTGAQVAGHYSKLAMAARAELPKELKHLAWLDLDSSAGAEYWAAMKLMGAYAAANHAVIHREIARHLGARITAGVENHHNFAWKETHVIDGCERPVIVHRKGATPAGAGVLGVIPGSMASPAYVVRGKGSAASLESASHGAGRVMSRTAARNSCSWSEARKLLRERDVHLISAGIDEVPFVYKDIDEVMAAQMDLVEVVARFDPRIVKMAPEGEKAED